MVRNVFPLPLMGEGELIDLFYNHYFELCWRGYRNYKGTLYVLFVFDMFIVRVYF